MSSGSTHFLNGDALFTYECPEAEYKSLKLYNKNIDWSTVKHRGEQPKSGRSFIPKSQSLQHIEELYTLHEWITKSINETRQQLNWRKETIPELTISQSWLNRSDTGEKHHQHIHPLSILSAILYMTEPAETQFIAKSIYSLPTIIAPDKQSQFLSNITHFCAKERMLVVFPSSLKHGVGANMEPFARYTFSANTWIKGAQGISSELAFIPERLNSAKN